MLYSSHAESHVPCFQERVGTGHPGYMIPDRLPWRHRARPSATLHEIQVRPKSKSELVFTMLQNARGGVKAKPQPEFLRTKSKACSVASWSAQGVGISCKNSWIRVSNARV
jgi:hypothetical protein